MPDLKHQLYPGGAPTTREPHCGMWVVSSLLLVPSTGPIATVHLTTNMFGLARILLLLPDTPVGIIVFPPHFATLFILCGCFDYLPFGKLAQAI